MGQISWQTAKTSNLVIATTYKTKLIRDRSSYRYHLPKRANYLCDMKLQWHFKEWAELDIEELYEILSLRIEVFVIEQNCPYQDADGKDKKSRHLFAMNASGKCVACLRLVNPGVSYDELSIGRVVTSPSLRGSGLGKELMHRSIEIVQNEGNPSVRISAQSHLQKFYETFGFKKVSEEYLEDDIPHVEMLRASDEQITQ